MNKRKRSQIPPDSIPRLASLLSRLQHAPQPKNEALPYLDQLMIFLEDPPHGVRDRWKKGAEMCAAWGLACTGASVWRLYRSHAIEWRLRLAEEVVSGNEPDECFEEKIMRLAERRTLEALSDPRLSAESLAHFSRIQLRKQALAFTLKRYEDNKQKEIHLARNRHLNEEEKRCMAEIRFNELKARLGFSPTAPPATHET